MRKSQVSTELVFFVGFAFVLLLVYLVISYNYLDFTIRRGDIISSINLLEEVRNEINLASRVENGYIRYYTLPNKINKKDYILNIENREVNINFEGVDHARLLSTTVTDDNNFKAGSTIIIKKENNQVMITCASSCIS